MWNVTQPLNAEVSPRPARLAYLVPKDPSDDLLDALIAESLSRWGGRRTPFIETDGEAITPADWALLDLWDADIIYSYVQLSETLENRLYREFAPAELKTHRELGDHDSSYGYRPDYSGNYSFVSSLSLLPFFARRAQAEGAALPEVVDTIHYALDDRDIKDTFGFVSISHAGQSLLPYARRICLSPEKKMGRAARPSNENDVSFIEDEEDFVAYIAKQRNVLCLNRLADMICPHLNHLARGKDDWSNHLTIVVGDAPADRLLFWNAQHRYPALDGTDDLSVLRFSPKRFENGPPIWLKDWISLRNHRHLHGNQAPRTVVRSCSIMKEELEEIANSLADNKMVMVSSEHHSTPCLFESCVGWRSENRGGTLATMFPSVWIYPRVNKGVQVRFQENQIEIPLSSPWHIQNYSTSPRSWGVWATDLRIERTEDHSQYSNQHHIWKFPRRFRFETTINFENYFSNQHLVLPPPPRPTESGDLTIWDSAELRRPVLTLPSDYIAFVSSILMFPPGSPPAHSLYKDGLSNARYGKISLSDKGRDLLGVFQFFQSLPEALAYLTDPFWLKVITELSPEEPESKQKNVTDIVDKLKITMDGDDIASPDYENIAKRALELAGRKFAAQSQQLKSKNFDQLWAWFSNGRGNDRENEMRDQLANSLTYLRDRGFLWQGFKWACSFCQHHNWIALDKLESISECEICRKPKSSPVANSLDFRLNPFVHHAFASTSAQGSVIWCIKQLAERATWSFSFAPTLDIYGRGSNRPMTDLDLVANVDGNIYLVEVKSSFSNVKQKDLDQLKTFAEELRPDVVMLAVANNLKDNDECVKMLQAFKKEFRVDGVRFELLTLGNASSTDCDDTIALPLAQKMSWSAW